jgi:chitin-binding protein
MTAEKHQMALTSTTPESARPRRRKPLRVALALLILTLAADGLWAHGSMLVPASRIYQCRFADDPENPANPACAAAVAFTGDNQFLYDWDGILRGDADGQHQVVVPDGELCSAGGAAYAGLDLPRSDWRATVIEPDAQGNFEFVYRTSIPHGTQDMLFFVTREGWDPAQPLTWADLDFVDEPGDDPADPFCALTSVTLSDYPEDPTLPDQVYRMTCPLPERTGRHVIYHVWQVDGSPLAFYGCIDVDFGAPGETVFADGFESGDTSAWSP